MRLLTNVLMHLWRGRKVAHRDFSSSGALLSRLGALSQQCTWIETLQDVLDYLREEAFPLLESFCNDGHILLAERLESRIYNHLIKSFEDPQHYNACLTLIHGPLQALGRKLAQYSSERKECLGNDWRPNRFLFFVHNLSSDLAHVRLLCDLIRSYLREHPHRASDIRIAGLAYGVIAPSLQGLRDEFNISLLSFPEKIGLYQVLLHLAKEVNDCVDERIIVVAAPLGLSFLSGLLHPERLGWLSMKFEISAFAGLVHRFSFTSGRRASKFVEHTLWRSAPPFFATVPEIRATKALPHSERIARHKQVFFTINRESKIRHPDFLMAVTRILQALPSACFVWTGRVALPDITSWFRAHALEDRCHFVGWIEPDALLSRGHIFLDTPILSGTIAAKSMLCGIPVISFEDAHSWINFFYPVLQEELVSVNDSHPLMPVRRLITHGLPLQCASLEEYVRLAVTLAKDESLRQLYADGLRALAHYYFLRSTTYATMHFDNFASTGSDPPNIDEVIMSNDNTVSPSSRVP